MSERLFAVVVSGSEMTTDILRYAHCPYLLVGPGITRAETFNFGMKNVPHDFDLVWMLSAGALFHSELPHQLADTLAANSHLGAIHPNMSEEEDAGLVLRAWLPMTALMVRREAWIQVGGYDLQLPSYAYGPDLGYRMRGNGWDLAMHPGWLGASALNSGSTARIDAFLVRNLIAKHGKNWAKRLEVD
jgi:hypothetical protein